LKFISSTPFTYEIFGLTRKIPVSRFTPKGADIFWFFLSLLAV